LLDSDPLLLTGNTDTVYCSVFLDLKTSGPTVVEIPPRCGPGTVNDAFFRFVTDMGMPGPDKGTGGKYLILPPDHRGKLSPTVGGIEAELDGEKYFVSRSTTYVNWLILRGFLVDGKPDAATGMFKRGFRVYDDPQTRSELQAGQPFPSKKSKRDNLARNADGSVDLYFGPKAPPG